MRFIPHTPGDIDHMLATIGASDTEDLFKSVPAELRGRARLELPDGLGEQQVLERMAALAARNRTGRSFQGAGAYDHFVPSAVVAILGRGEFATAYTPYQPEVSQGTLQACFEFQTYVSILSGLEVANASLYDGASALAEAVLMALRLAPKRNKILISEAVHPEYIEVVRTYLDGHGRGSIETIGIAADGRTDLKALQAALSADVAAVCIGYPNFLGVIDDLSNAARLAKRIGALTVSVTTEALALALLRAPGACGTDIAVAEGQSLGLPMSYGGPGLGLFATRRVHVRQMPGRLVGETVDEEGRRGYVLTLSTREQHIRREKATSNICTNQGLAALGMTVYLGLAGRNGLRKLAEYNAVRARGVATRLEAAGFAPLYAAPFFNEFTIEVPGSQAWFESAVAGGLCPGVRLSERGFAADAGDERVIVTVTETNSDDDIDALVASLVTHLQAKRETA